MATKYAITAEHNQWLSFDILQILTLAAIKKMSLEGFHFNATPFLN